MLSHILHHSLSLTAALPPSPGAAAGLAVIAGRRLRYCAARRAGRRNLQGAGPGAQPVRKARGAQ